MLQNDVLRLIWDNDKEGYAIKELTLLSGQNPYSFSDTKGSYTILYSPEKPSSSKQTILNEKGAPIQFPEPEYYYLESKWKSSTTAVALNRAGEAFLFYPSSVRKKDNAVHFSNKNDVVVTDAIWQLDSKYKNDLLVTITIKALKAGFFLLQHLPYSMEMQTIFNGQQSPEFYKENPLTTIL
ncbi:hypothetical protein [Niabella ginsengisoli]|uniref:Uncharacterized protein n=1 Tax=Niabella ginsengisoli TaxID=522298 RepID=A0ABS9SJ55_9BACT|nr:hypothetical protein [Niabella ginsengisoli]MCH5598402.1 hypothetical protein [Niabella ginsengisoli]